MGVRARRTFDYRLPGMQVLAGTGVVFRRFNCLVG
jgi:hypothetical protein